MAKKVLRVFGVVVLIVLGVVFWNMSRLSSKQLEVAAARPQFPIQELAERLSRAIQIQTVSFEDSALIDTAAFLAFHEHIRQSFPLVMQHLHLEVINSYSLLFHWQGKDASLNPAILLAHMDVVPVDTINETWDFPPFAGLIRDGFICGRGSLDDKLSVMGMLEAVELLLSEGFQPQHDWYFAFGHDEELTGRQGAVQLKSYLQQKGVKASFILDEGLVVTNGMVPGITAPVALIGISEKGYLTLKLEVSLPGGHSSMPEPENALTVLAKAITAIQAKPFRPEISEPVESFISYVGPEAPFVLKLAFANRWLFESMILSTYQKSAAGSALVQSTIAPTILKAGVKENVIPSYATAAVNLRLLPGLSIEEVLNHFTEVIADERVKIIVIGAPKEASPVASVETEAFAAIHTSIREVFPDAKVAPSLVLATTDSRHYTELSDNIYKFLPVSIDSEDISGIHGKNEKISLENYASCISFYYQLMKK
ncbi:MAG: M20 family peptidase [Bacteroidales bacterium]|nr:M20 family peptidase [Bacteroidales bacterium]